MRLPYRFPGMRNGSVPFILPATTDFSPLPKIRSPRILGSGLKLTRMDTRLLLMGYPGYLWFIIIITHGYRVLTYSPSRAKSPSPAYLNYRHGGVEHLDCGGRASGKETASGLKLVWHPGPAHAREIRRVLVASMDFRAPRVRPRIFPYTPGFVLAVHVHGNLRPAHLACVGERLTIRDDLKKLYRQAVGELRKERKKSDCSHTEEGQAGGKQADCTPRLRSKGEGECCVKAPGRLRRPRPAPLHSRPGCTPRPARRSGLTAFTTDTNTTPSRRQTWGTGEAISREPGSEAPGAGRGVPVGCSGVPRTGTAGPREWEQRVPGTGATGPESGAATHGAVHGHFLPCTGMYRDRVRAYNVQYTTCTQKVVHFRECTGHVRDWTRFVCRSETLGFYRKPKISGKVCGNFSHGNYGFCAVK
ncbi:hypothetical protein Bbelb_000570 [Branchiostoma belcheri]|nr:hypothetical protein Bbelb_000570 [Branchiostoma belcheri]